MSIFTFHLVTTTFTSGLKRIINPPFLKNVPGLVHAECMTSMTLGAPLLSRSRILVGELAVFAQWENEEAIDNFLENDQFGKTMAKGWHTRLLFLRQWGRISEFRIPEAIDDLNDTDASVVAFTLARMRFLQIPRFIHWGRPVEKLVRDHPGITLALAAIRFPNTVATFSVWKSQKEMTDMVHGRSAVEKPKRHAQAMKERNRKDFHYEFTTLRFKPISEFGEWKGRSEIIPNLNSK